MRGAPGRSLATCWVALLAACCFVRGASAGNGAFTIRHEKTSKCLQVKNSQIMAADCKEANETLWKWVSQNRLFHLGSRQCLGLNIAKPASPLKMVNCDSQLMLWWRCVDASVFGASQYKLTLKDNVVTASINSSDAWRRSNSSDDICEYPYREIYTRDGNSYGRPCEFPFLVNKTWYHDCIRDETHTDGDWCATTSSYNQDAKWGICLKPEDGCRDTWEHNPGSESCYQLNTQSALSWKEAYISCQTQGGDLLSITNTSELSYIQAKDGIAEVFWIGLNQLDISGGWQWSDHTPLNFLNWNPDMQNVSPLDGSSCVAMNAASGQWQSYHCETTLPYVCKKPLNNTKSELPDVWRYLETQCDTGWLPYSGFCYMLMNNQASWNMASQSCRENKSDLISIHSLADVELVVTKLHNETKEEIWMGFMNENTPALFKWSDGSKVVFTYWDQNEPEIPFNSTPNCVSYSGKLGRWRVKSCEEKLKYVCMKKGEVLNETSDTHCFPKEGWKRHGDFCYKIHNNKVSFGAQCNLTIMNRFEQEFINSLIGKYSKGKEKYFWIGLQDINRSGKYTWGDVDGRKNEAVMYANWNSLQPAFPGGCVAMSSGKSLGKWEAKDCKTFTALSICKNYTGPPRQPEVLPKPTDPCPPGWQNGSGLACYKFFHSERLLRTRTWEEAERFCEALGGHLPSFSDIAEMKELHYILRDIISNDRWVWVGLNKRNPDSLGTWQWSDNNPETTVVMSHDFQRDVYDIRDCAALKTTRISRRYFWRLHFYDDRQLDFYLKPFLCDARLEWVCQITKGSTPKTPEWYTPDVDGIHGPPLVIDGSEFWFVPDKNLSYQEAALYCANNDSDLASVDSYTKLRALLTKIEKLSGAEQKWWLKYMDHGASHHSPLQLFPRFHDRFWRDCWYISSKGWYRDYPINCNQKLPFICEKSNASLLEKHEPEYHLRKGGCPKEWILFQNKCFLKIEHRFLTFKKANEVCETFGGTLPSISSQAEQDFLTSLLPGLEENIWIGLKFFFNIRENKWVDGSRLLYSNFHPLLRGRLRKIPLNMFDDEINNQCGIMLNNPKSLYVGTWNFLPCAEEHFLGICQKPAGAADNQTQQVLSETLTYQNVHYAVILKNLSWYDALRECKQKNMQLVSITDQYQQAFLTVQAAVRNYPLWIGLFSKDDEKHYGWADGKRIDFSRWSEEDEETSEECVFLDIDGFWKTSVCSSENPGAICYLPRNETEKEKVVEHIKCPHKFKNTPWISFQNSCYTFMITKDRWQEMKSQEAHHLCKKINPDAFVLNIRDEEENNFVVEQLRSFSGLATWVWLGVIYDDSDNSLKWYDETYLSYNNWKQGRPNVKKNQFFAGVNRDGFWDIYDLTQNWQALQFNQHSILACKIEMGPRENKPPLPEYILHGNSTYKVLQKKITWYEALRECKQNGSDLVSIHSESHQVFLEDIVKRDGYPLWLGLSSLDGSESYLEWSDGSEFDYRPWELENSTSIGNCVFLDTKGFWKRKRCTDIVDGAICYTSSEKRLLQPQQTRGSSRCPQGTRTSQWLQYKDHCYAFDMALYNFSVYTAEDAKRVCQKLDPSATLLTIKDAEENTFVSKHIRQNDLITRRVWLGLSQNFKAKSLNWLDGSAVKYANWANGTSKVNGKCSVILSTNGTWSEVDCSHSKGRVVCKAPLGTNHTGVAITFALLIILVLVAGLIWYLYKKKRLQWGGFFAVRYERGMNEDETDSMFTKDGY